MNSKTTEIIKSSYRYRDFTLLDKPIFLKKLCEGKDRVYVQLHDVTLLPQINDIVGFCGVIEYKKGKIRPLDGDSYSENMKIWGYEWFTCEEFDCDGVDILVEDW